MANNGYIYLVWPQEAIKRNEPVYKVGCTRNLRERVKSYGKFTEVRYSAQVDLNPFEVESRIMKKLREIDQFKQRVDYGREYFEGDIDEMVEVVHYTVRESCDKRRPLSDLCYRMYMEFNTPELGDDLDSVKKAAVYVDDTSCTEHYSEMTRDTGSQEYENEEDMVSGMEGLLKREFVYDKVTEEVSMNAMKSVVSQLDTVVDKMIEYNSETMEPLGDIGKSGVVVLEAGCGMGKTEGIRAYIKSISKETKVLVISATRSVCCKVQSDLKDLGFTLYMDEKKSGIHKTKIERNRLVICVNSLTRLDDKSVSDMYDLLIIDEAKSVNQSMFQPSNMMNHQIVGPKLEALIKRTAQVVLIDANMSNLQMVLWVEWMKLTRPSVGTSGMVTWIRNTHVRTTNREAEVVYVDGNVADAKSHMCESILEVLERGEHVCLAVSSPEIAEFVATIVVSRMPEKRVGCYTSSTDETTKLEDFRDANMTFRRYDLLVYSPTITAGVSFTLAHYDWMFAWFINSPGTPPVDACLQMLFRVRQLQCGQMMIYVSGVHKMLENMETVHPGYIANECDQVLEKTMFVNRNYCGQLEYNELRDKYKYDKRRMTWVMMIGQEYNERMSRMCFDKLLINELTQRYGIPVKATYFADMIKVGQGNSETKTYATWKEERTSRIESVPKRDGREPSVHSRWGKDLNRIGMQPYDKGARNEVLKQEELEVIQTRYMNKDKTLTDTDIHQYYMSVMARQIWKMRVGTKINQEMYESWIQLKKGDMHKEIKERRYRYLRFSIHIVYTAMAQEPLKQVMGQETPSVIQRLMYELEKKEVDIHYTNLEGYTNGSDVDETMMDHNSVLHQSSRDGNVIQKLLLSQGVLESLVPDRNEMMKLATKQDIKKTREYFTERFEQYIRENGGEKAIQNLIRTFSIPTETFNIQNVSKKSKGGSLNQPVKDMVELLQLDSRKTLYMLKHVMKDGLGLTMSSKQKSDRTGFCWVISADNHYVCEELQSMLNEMTELNPKVNSCPTPGGTEPIDGDEMFNDPDPDPDPDLNQGRTCTRLVGVHVE
jgi:Origin of replication binding protein/T5orf172 domain